MLMGSLSVRRRGRCCGLDLTTDTRHRGTENTEYTETVKLGVYFREWSWAEIPTLKGTTKSKETLTKFQNVIPVKTGIQEFQGHLVPRSPIESLEDKIRGEDAYSVFP
jgi:hypothetical protein